MGVAALLAARKLASLEASLGFSERPGPGRWLSTGLRRGPTMGHAPKKNGRRN